VTTVALSDASPEQAQPEVVRPTDTSVDLDTRILDAALVLVARWGVGKTSLSDIAKEAGCARASVYRAFPGGKQQLFVELGLRELSGYMESIIEAVDSADDLADSVTRGLVVAARLLHDHEAAQFVLAHEPEVLMPFLGFKQVDRVYGHVSATVGPHLERLVAADRAGWLAEWASRAFITYLFNPTPEFDLAQVDHARRLVSSFVIPAFEPCIDLKSTRPQTSYGSTHVHH
jgi:AcrR family transcriptional regulator